MSQIANAGTGTVTGCLPCEERKSDGDTDIEYDGTTIGNEDTIDPVIRKGFFRNIILEVIHTFNANLRVQHLALDALQVAAESHLEQTFRFAKKLALHRSNADDVEVESSDFSLACRVIEERKQQQIKKLENRTREDTDSSEQRAECGKRLLTRIRVSLLPQPAFS